MDTFVPAKIFLTKGMGQHKEKLASLEQALRAARIAPYNLVKISSIFPPHCKLISRDEGIKQLTPGQILYLVMSENSTDEAHRLVSASIGLAIPNDSRRYGYLSEHHGFGQNEKEAGQYAEDLAAYMLATTIEGDYDAGEIWDEAKSVYKISDKIIVRTRNITQTARGKKGMWTTVVAAAICLP
jgi:arginine decarboxylase